MFQGHMLGHILHTWDFKYQQNGEKGFIFVLTNISKKSKRIYTTDFSNQHLSNTWQNLFQKMQTS